MRRFALAKVTAPAVGRGKSEQKGKTVSYRTALNTCPSFLNEVKNLAKVARFKCFSLCTPTCPYRLARLGTSRPKAKRLIVFSRRYAPKNTIRLPPISGEADIKEERNHSFYYLNTLLTISYAGFFAKSQIIFFSSVIISVLSTAQE